MRLPSYRKHSSGCARVTIAGKDFLLGPHGSPESKRKYQRLIAEYLAGDRSSSFGTPAVELTLIELLASYKKHCRKYYGTGDNSEYWRFVPVWNALKTLYGTDNCVQFGPLQLKALRAHLSLPRTVKLKDGSKKTTQRSRGYINNLTKRTLRIFKWGASEGMVPISIHQGLKSVEPLKRGRSDLPESKKIKPVDADTIMATVAHLPKLLADMIRIQGLLGSRPGELCALKPCMIDRSTEKNEGIWTITLVDHKGEWRGHERVILVGPKAQELLRPYLLRPDNAYLFNPREAQKQRRPRTTPINYGNRPGKSNHVPKTQRTIKDCYTTATYGRAIRRACLKAQIPPWSPNQIRHAAGTDARKEFGLEVASLLLGHASPSTTLIYAQSDRQKLIDAVREVG